MALSNSIEDHVRSRLDELSPKLRKAAGYVISHSDEIATRSLRHAAKRAGITPATLSRLARALDCDDYEELREICRQDLKRRNKTLASKATTLIKLSTETDPPASSAMILAQGKSAISSIQKLMETVDLKELRKAADMIVGARKVLLVGALSTLAMMNYFARMGQLAFDNWNVVGADGGAWSPRLARLGSGDVVIILSLNPYATACIKAAKFARQAGATSIVITDSYSSPASSVADFCFLVETESPQFFPSHVATLVLLEGLMGMIIRRGGNKVAGRIQAAEDIGRRFEEMWDEA